MSKKRERRERERMLMLDPSTLDSICEFVANRGTVIRWCREKDIRFNEVWGWLHGEKDRLAAYAKALEVSKARLEAKVTDRMEEMMDADVRDAVGPKGRLLPTKKLPDAVARSVVEISDTPRGGTKLKLVAPDRSTEMMGRHLGMFRDKLDVKVEGGIAGRLAAARQRRQGQSKG